MASVERHANAVSTAAVDKAKLICADHPHVRFVATAYICLINVTPSHLILTWPSNNATQVKVETLVESGDPRDVICNATEKIGADLLVMGSHGYGFIQRFGRRYCIFCKSVRLDDASVIGYG